MSDEPNTSFIEDGAKIPLHLALDDINGVTGQYWANEDMSSADHGKVMKW